MTSANFFNGYTTDKPTSRVSNPPGGRSNNIFGSAAHQSEEDQHQQLKQEALANKTNQNSHFDSSAPVPTETATKDCHRVVNNTDRQKSSVFQDDAYRSYNPKQSKRTGFNPITGKSYEDEEVERQKQQQQYKHNQDEKKEHELQEHNKQEQKQQAHQDQQKIMNQQEQSKEVHTSSRVSQPPGGRSTKLW
jgi:hypothetical protein